MFGDWRAGAFVLQRAAYRELADSRMTKKRRDTDQAARAARLLRGEEGEKLRPDEETGEQQMEEGEGLEFEDPFGDDFEEEEVYDAREEDEDGDDETKEPQPLMDEGDEDEQAANTRVWRAGVDPLEEGEELDYDPSAYHMYHSLRPEWPCLSFDFLRDDLGDGRQRFPLTMYAVVGTQADRADRNKISLLKLSDLHRTHADDSDEDDDGEDEPTLDHVSVPHRGGVNRIRSMPQTPGIVASWADSGHVHIWDLRSTFTAMQAGAPRSAPTRPYFTFDGHRDEGFAMDWSRADVGKFATGDNSGRIFVWTVGDATSVDRTPYVGHSGSVEDLQWSHTETTVFASASSDGTFRIWDTRGRTGPMISVQAHAQDVNVLSWNRHVSYLLATGSDDGSFKVWDMRYLSQEPVEPRAHFPHHTQPVTSIEWAPHDESMIAVSSADNQVTIWDLSVEPDEEAAVPSDDPAVQELPQQLLFIHQGQSDVKEVHFHPQIPGVLMTTAADGYNIFKPAITVSSV